MEELEELTQMISGEAKELESEELEQIDEETINSDSEFTDSRSLVLKEYLKKYIILGIDNDIQGETLLTHSSYLNDNDVMIVQWIKHMYLNNQKMRTLLSDEKAICLIVNFADKKMQDLQMNAKDVTPKDMEAIMKKSIKYADSKLEKKSLLDYSGMKWYIKLKNKILEYFNKK